MGPNNEGDPDPFIFKTGPPISVGDKVKGGTVETEFKKCPGAHLSLLYLLLFSEKRPLAGFTFELFATFSQIIHPFQDFGIRSLVTV